MEELSLALQDEYGQAVIVVRGREGEVVCPGFKLVSVCTTTSQHTEDSRNTVTYVSSGSETTARVIHTSQSHTRNVFTATPSGATFLPPTLGRARLEEENKSTLTGAHISLVLEDRYVEEPMLQSETDCELHIENGVNGVEEEDVKVENDGQEEGEGEEEGEVEEGLMVNISLPVSMFQFCPSCGLGLHSVDTLKEHCSQCLAGHPLKFLQCNKQEKGSKGKRFQCNNCGKKFPTKKGFTKHRYFCDPTVLLADHALSEQQHGNSDFCTDLAKAKGLDGEGSATELDGGKKKDSHTCLKCNKTFSCLSYLKQHHRIHTGEKPFPCTTCGKAFNDRSALRNHHKLHTNERPFKCDVCSKEFRRSDSLKYHKASHDPNNRPYICSHCAKSFKNQKDLRSHEKTVHCLAVSSNSGEMFVCTDCNASCDSVAGLKYHRKVMHGTGKIFECEFCGKKCLASSQLEIHLRSHTGERPFKCSHCDKSFRRRNHLLVHEGRHTGANTYQCDQCSRGFPQASELKQHRKIHTGQKPYECGLCGKCFAREDYVKIHMKTHSAATFLPSLAEHNLAQVDVKSLEAGPGLTKHVYVMEPDVPGGNVHHSLLGLAHVRGDKEVGATIVIPHRVQDSGLLYSVPGLLETQH